jgi:1-acyl-sn-glycerol-3-phosphate acyltransferase
VCTLPVVTAVTLAADFVRDPMKMPWTRMVLGVCLFASVDVLCLILAGLIWLGYFVVPGWRGERYVELNSWLQFTWGRLLLGGVTRIFGMTLEQEGRECLEAGGPIIYLVRHVSVLDAVLPIVLGPPHSRVFRFVLKAELLNDPLLDIVGQRLRNHFVRRGSDNPEAEIEAVVRLTRGLMPHEGYVMYPEGTRFTPKRRTRILASLAKRDPEGAAYGARLEATLPPTRRGPIALLDQARGVDVVILSHRGLEASSHIHSFLRGAMVGKTLAVRFERFKAEDIPPGPEGARRWLEERWLEVDAFATGS